MKRRPEQPKANIGKGAGIGVVALLAALGAFVVPLEGLRLESYADPVWGASLPTACAGDTGPHIRMGQTFTESECYAMLAARHRVLAARLGRCVAADVPANVAVSVLSLGDNVGAQAVCDSTLVRMINQGAVPLEYCAQFDRWVYAAGRDCRIKGSNCGGLVKRRATERAMCEGRMLVEVAG